MKKKVFLGAVFLFLWGVASARGHDLWLYLPSFYLPAKATAEIRVMFGHNFPHEDLMLPPESLSRFLVLTPSGKNIPVKRIEKRPRMEGDRPSPRHGHLAAFVSLEEEGLYVVGVSRVRKGTPKSVPSGKFAKALLVSGRSDRGRPDRLLGQRLEIVPLANPAKVRPGDYFPVRILFEGRPLSTFVYATYAGYWSEKDPFPVIVRSDSRGLARIKIEKPGIWMIVCNHKIDFSATLTFEIRP